MRGPAQVRRTGFEKQCLAKPASSGLFQGVIAYRVVRLAELHHHQLSRYFHRQRHTPHLRRSPCRNLSVHSSSMQLRDNCGRIGYAPIVVPISARRIPRHFALNDVVRRGFSAADITSKLEPSGLDRGYGKRPDRITVYPYSHVRCLIWDVHQHLCIFDPNTSRVRRLGYEKRQVHCVGLTIHLQPVAVETSVAMVKSTIKFDKDFGRRLAE